MIKAKKILVTGSRGLIGRELCKRLVALGAQVVELDILGSGPAYGDVCSEESVQAKVKGVSGVVHLAAVSRVVWGESDPEKCYHTNVGGTGNIIGACLASPFRPWVLFSSSREVYGEQGKTALDESAPYNPVSIYGVSKVRAEEIVLSARCRGINTGVVRFSNVYGCPRDHRDRVIPAFVLAALQGRPLRVEGGDNRYDFTHLTDTVDGLIGFIDALYAESRFPPIHFLTEVSTSLSQLAKLVISELGSSSKLLEAPSRSYGSGVFMGKNANGLKLLGWKAKVDLASGVRQLAKDFQKYDTSYSGS